MKTHHIPRRFLSFILPNSQITLPKTILTCLTFVNFCPYLVFQTDHKLFVVKIKSNLWMYLLKTTTTTNISWINTDFNFTADELKLQYFKTTLWGTKGNFRTLVSINIIFLKHIVNCRKLDLSNDHSSVCLIHVRSSKCFCVKHIVLLLGDPKWSKSLLSV